MPQKTNPDLLELVRGKAARVAGDATTLLVAVKGLPLAYNKDLQETQQPLFDASETVLSVLPLIAGFMKVVEFDYDRMQKTAESGFMNAWAAATYLVERGVPFRVAHEQIGKVVQLCAERNCELQDIELHELPQINPAFDQDFYSFLSLSSVLAIHDVPGGTAPARVQQVISEARIKINLLRESMHAHA